MKPFNSYRRCSFSGKQVEKSRRHSGLSLLEIMVVVTIMGIISAVVAYTVIGQEKIAKKTAAITQIRNFMQALDIYSMTMGTYPSANEGLKALLKNNPNTNSPFIRSIPKDPWGNPYFYELIPNGYRITCFGEDGKKGGTEFRADIKSTDM